MATQSKVVIYNPITKKHEPLAAGDTISSDKVEYQWGSDTGSWTAYTSPFEPGLMLKLTTEAFGMGVQLSAELLSTPAAETITLRPIGELESYQRRCAPRADASIPFLNVPQKSSLQAFQREWRRVITDLHKPLPPHLKMHNTSVNISAGGISFEMPGTPTPLSIMVIDLQDQLSPVCAVSELIWQRHNEDRTSIKSGHRFVEILKEDQERISLFVEKITGVKTVVVKNRELMDRITP